jgi:hypothetical protein
MPKIAVNIPDERVAAFEAFDLLNYRLRVSPSHSREPLKPG